MLKIIDKKNRGEKILAEDIVESLTCKDPELLETLFQHARLTRSARFDKNILAYGFVYFSNYCKNNCSFCYARRDHGITRYRKPLEETRQIAKELADSGVHLIDLTMGEDPYFLGDGGQRLSEMITAVKSDTGLPVMISPGVAGREAINVINSASPDWYALYQETHNKDLFTSLRLDQDYDERFDTKLYAKSSGMKIEEGIMVGIGETPDDIANSILTMGEIGASQMRVMTFVPQDGIPLNREMGPTQLELRVIAIMRILYPDALIPASLDIEGLAGLKSRLNAGANVITSIIPPQKGLIGVAKHEMNVDDGLRTLDAARPVVEELNLTIASRDFAMEWLSR